MRHKYDKGIVFILLLYFRIDFFSNSDVDSWDILKTHDILSILVT